MINYGRNRVTQSFNVQLAAKQLQRKKAKCEDQTFAPVAARGGQGKHTEAACREESGGTRSGEGGVVVVCNFNKRLRMTSQLGPFWQL